MWLSEFLTIQFLENRFAKIVFYATMNIDILERIFRRAERREAKR